MRQPASDPDLDPRGPGRLLLRIARLVFDPGVIKDVILPTIGDLRREVAAAASDRGRRSRALWQGYRAFWTLVLLAPVSFTPWTRQARLGSAFPDIAERIAFALIGITVASSLLVLAGGWALAPALASAMVAVAVHAWWRRHPSRVALPQRGRTPEINLSSIPVGGDLGGLIFVVGSVLIVTAGIPMVRWFLVGVIAGGVGLAIFLTRWHAVHGSRSAVPTISTR